MFTLYTVLVRYFLLLAWGADALLMYHLSWLPYEAASLCDRHTCTHTHTEIVSRNRADVQIAQQELHRICHGSQEQVKKLKKSRTRRYCTDPKP